MHTYSGIQMPLVNIIKYRFSFGTFTIWKIFYEWPEQEEESLELQRASEEAASRSRFSVRRKG